MTDFMFDNSNYNKATVTIRNDGTVEIAEGVTLDEASHEFWDAVQTLGLEQRQTILEEAARVCDALAEEAEEDTQLEHDERFCVYAKKYRKAAQQIRTLKKKK